MSGVTGNYPRRPSLPSKNTIREKRIADLPYQAPEEIPNPVRYYNPVEDIKFGKDLNKIYGGIDNLYG